MAKSNTSGSPIWTCPFHQQQESSQNEPSILNFQYLQRVTLDPSRITDWMYYDGETVIGAYTTKVLQNRLGNPQ